MAKFCTVEMVEIAIYGALNSGFTVFLNVFKDLGGGPYYVKILSTLFYWLPHVHLHYISTLYTPQFLPYFLTILLCSKDLLLLALLLALLLLV